MVVFHAGEAMAGANFEQGESRSRERELSQILLPTPPPLQSYPNLSFDGTDFWEEAIKQCNKVDGSLAKAGLHLAPKE